MSLNRYPETEKKKKKLRIFANIYELGHVNLPKCDIVYEWMSCKRHNSFKGMAVSFWVVTENLSIHIS